MTIERVGDFLEVDLRRIFVWLKSGFKFTIVISLLCAFAAAAYGLLAPRYYSVSTDVMVGPVNMQVINNDLYAQPTQQGEGQRLAVSNRARLMTSGNVLMRVVQNLKLGEDPEFYKPASQGFISSLLGSSSPRTAPDVNLAALKVLQTKISLDLDDRSFIVRLSVTAQSVDKAIAIAKAIIEAFNAELANTESETASRAAKALDDRLTDLKKDALAAEEAVETYKRSHGLATGENGQLVSVQTMSQTNAQILAARNRVIEAQTNYNTLLHASDSAAATIPVTSDSLRELKLRAGALEQQLSSLQMVYGLRHPSIARTQSELNSVREQIKNELQRATNTARTELDRANQALKSLSSNMADLEKSTFNDAQSQVELRDLQRQAQARTEIYENFLVRVRQISEREMITTDTVKVVTAPLPPSGRSWPPGTPLLFVVGAVLGLIIGIGLSLIRGLYGDINSKSVTRVEE
ncbi:GumC family protein [Rhizobium oryzicola]|uniref:GumC family protein n=1 Tax=Rhizobium oryzicola TaxID=1232668 RepID=A0ABT8SYS9_9HYPH|nr:GumC family protein [Rhizobium oryzicola]MDO1582787.1 GumC family protein [Rhizobium oryzicola]